jgi:hypothetical protein
MKHETILIPLAPKDIAILMCKELFARDLLP